MNNHSSIFQNPADQRQKKNLDTASVICTHRLTFIMGVMYLGSLALRLFSVVLSLSTICCCSVSTRQSRNSSKAFGPLRAKSDSNRCICAGLAPVAWRLTHNYSEKTRENFIYAYSLQF